MKRGLRQFFGIVLAFVMVLQMATAVLPLPVHAEEATAQAADTLYTTIEKQIRAYAKSIDQIDADDEAAMAIAKHGVTGGGKKMSVGKNHALTATLMNSEMGLAAVIRGCEMGIELMQRLNCTEIYANSGCYWGYDPLYFFNIIHSEKSDEGAGMTYDAESVTFTGKTNGYDSSLGWIAGAANAHTTITKANVTADTVTYNVTVTFVDRFDFSTSSNSGFNNLISGLGALMFKEFDWAATATFSLTVENECPHDSDAYYWRYDAGMQNMASVTTDEFGGNQATKHTIAKADAYYFELDRTVTLRHNVPWELEYTVKRPGQIVLSSTPRSPTDRFEFQLYSRKHFFIRNAEKIQGTYKYHCYGYTLANLFPFAVDQTYTIRLENVVAEDGSNMIYISVYNHDQQQTVLEPLPMDDYYWMQDGVLTLQDDESRGLSGEDLRINYIGNRLYRFSADTFELKVWENGKNGENDSCFDDKITKPTCSAKGYTTHTCVLCGYSYKTDYVEKTSHSYTSKVTPPTCASQGYTTYTCTACGDSFRDHYVDRDAHKYEFVITEPTCTKPGCTTYTCTVCGHSYQDDVVEALGHRYRDWVVIEYVTCTENGYRQRECQVCRFFDDEVVEATGHQYNAVVTAPTCTKQGYTTYTCHCGDRFKDSYVDATGHSFGEWTEVKAPTCAEKGSERRDCANCNHFETRDVAAAGHKYEVVVTAPECTKAGFTTHTCHCGESRVDGYVAALGHDWDAGVVTKEPTEEETGTRLHKCTRCDETKTETIPTLEHVHKYEAVVTAPTCTAQGYTTHTCRCGDSYVDSKVDALGHKLGNWETTKDATCTEDGSQRRDCERCDYFETETIAATGHKYESVVTAPTCTEDGYTTHTCHCGNSYVDSKVDALGHKLGDWETTKDATCTEDGSKRRDCERCDYFETEVIKAAGHKYEAVVTAPTCTAQGYTTYTCACCDSYVSDYVDALGHKLGDWETTKDATCTEDGSKRRDCDRCDYFETEVIEATGHKYEAVVTAPTCTAQGYTTHTCHCGDSYVDSKVDALGHDWDAGVVTKEPTEEETGTRLHNCNRCDETKTVTIPTLAHVHKYEAVVTAPTCTAQGYTTYTCACGDSYVSDYVDALGHDLVPYPEQNPTCVKDGWEAYEACSRCEYTTCQPIPAKGHQYSDTVIPPTCTAEGYTLRECTVCGINSVVDYVDALGHKEVILKAVAPTCTATGLTEGSYCASCGKIFAAQQVVAALGHSYKSVVTAPACTKEGYTTYTCHCGHSYVDNKVSALGHKLGEWTVVTELKPDADGEERRTCQRCDFYESRKVSYPGIMLKLEGEDLTKQKEVWIEGMPYPVITVGDSKYVELQDEKDFVMVTYTYQNADNPDVHTQYPTGMKVYKVSDGKITHIKELDNLLQYSGSSIRITGKKGIRMITSITKANKTALTGKGLAGYKLVEYGTALCWASEIKEGDALTLGKTFTRSNYAYKKGVADPIFATTKDLVQYTNVLVGFTNDQCKDDIAMRPYIILEDAKGEKITLYGGTVYRSIGYIAYQNRNVVKKGTEAYKYVWDIIHYVYGNKYDADYKG